MGFADANSHLAQSGVRSLKFEKAGDSASGILKDVELAVVTNTKQEVQYKKDGTTPKEQLVLTLATDQRDPEIAGDDGYRKFYCSWRAEAALKSSMRAAGADGLEPEAKVTIKYTGDTKVKVPDSNMTVSAKEYDIEYVRPTFAAGRTEEPKAEAEDFPAEDKVLLAQGLLDSGIVDKAVLSKASGLTEEQVSTFLVWPKKSA